MKAIVVTDRSAGTAGMKLMERPEPRAAINDVVIQVHASGFTRDELTWPATWTDRLGRDRTPSIPGHELSGVVTALGYGTTGLSVGQRVFGLTDWTRDGTLAEYVAVEARNLAPLPGDVDFTVGAALVMPGLTAWQGLFQHGRLQAGQSVLVHDAASVVGSMVTQLARGRGLRHRRRTRGQPSDGARLRRAGVCGPRQRRPGRCERSRSSVRYIRPRHREAIRARDTSRRNAGDHRWPNRSTAFRRPDDRLRCRVRPRSTERDRSAGAGGTSADEHRQNREP
jgi:hypothetical protein